jgi:hypothetical protein
MVLDNFLIEKRVMKVSMLILTYPDKNQTGIEVFSEKTGTLMDLKIWKLKSIWLLSLQTWQEKFIVRYSILSAVSS